MDEKSKEVITKLQRDPALARQLLQSADGQKLLQLLTQDGGGQLQQAGEKAARGDTSDMLNMLRQVMSSPEGSLLIQRIRRQSGV